MTPPAALPRLARRVRDSHKHDYGRVVVIGGATGMAGAPALSALAALRCGAGLVEVLVPEPVAAITAGFDPCLMARGFPADADGCFASAAIAALAARAAAADALVVGPGLGRGGAVRDLVARLWREAAVPTVFDADALWALSPAPPVAGAGPRLMTPHEGELRRFLARPAGDRVALEEEAARLAAATGAVVLLKGPDTLVVDGADRWHNATGNPGMATAGSGDVLAGMIAALACQPCLVDGTRHDRPGLAAAARMGAWAHGRAGDVAANALGEIPITARDILTAIPAALGELVAPDSATAARGA